MITVPSILFGLVVALLAGALFHALRGGSGWRLLLNFGLSAFGFALSQLAGMQFGLTLYQFGMLDIGIGLIGSVLMLLLGDWLSRIETPKKTGV
jgi:hypothetical protein